MGLHYEVRLRNGQCENYPLRSPFGFPSLPVESCNRTRRDTALLKSRSGTATSWVTQAERQKHTTECNLPRLRYSPLERPHQRQTLPTTVKTTKGMFSLRSSQTFFSDFMLRSRNQNIIRFTPPLFPCAKIYSRRNLADWTQIELMNQNQILRHKISSKSTPTSGWQMVTGLQKALETKKERISL